MFRQLRVQHRRRVAASVAPAPFHPSELYPTISGWFRNEVSSGAISSVPDLINVGNAAVQATPANRPTGALSPNGQPVVQYDGNDFLSLPVSGPYNGALRWGYHQWIRPSTVSGVRTLLALTTIGGASASRVLLQLSGASVFVNVYHSNFVVRRATMPNVLAANTWGCLSVEMDAQQADETVECVMRWNAVRKTLTFSVDSGGAAEMPESYVQPAGNWLFGDCRTSSPLQPFTGQMGQDGFFLAGAGGLSGGGLITDAQAENLMAFNPPIDL